MFEVLRNKYTNKKQEVEKKTKIQEIKELIKNADKINANSILEELTHKIELFPGTELDLSSCNTMEHDLKDYDESIMLAIIKGVKLNNINPEGNIKLLDLSNCPIRNKGVKALAELISENKTIKTLKIENTLLNDSNISPIIHEAENNKILEEVYLPTNSTITVSIR